MPASQLTAAHVNSADYSYAYDAIGNRTSATEDGTSTAYTSNRLNQYTAEGSFTPTFDADGNQTLIKTSTGTWSVTYNAKNRPVRFEKADSSIVVECTYDTMGRRATKKVTTNGTLTEHRRFLYRGYLQIDSPPPHRRLTPAGQSRFAHCPTGLTAVGRLACCDLTRAYTPALWFITWDPTQPTATRPLAIQKNGTWYTYGWDLTKNICETYRTDGRIDLAYTYTPYGECTPAHTYDQPIRWSSEYHDTELGIVYYNYRHYNPAVGRWMRMDPASDGSDIAKYGYIKNRPISHGDSLGLEDISIKNSCLKLRPEVISKGFWGYHRTGLNNNDTLHVRNDFFIIVYPVWEDTCECNEERKQYYETLSYKITATFTYNSHDWRSSRTNSMFKTILGGIDKLELDWGTVLASGGHTNLYANSGGFGLMYHEIANKADAIIKLDKSPGGKIMDLHYRIIFDNDISRVAWDSHQISKS